MADIDDRWFRTVEDHKVATARHGVGKRWLARWRDGAGIQRKRSFAHKDEAERFLAKITTDLAGHAYVDPRAGRVAVREPAERWRTAQVHRATTATPSRDPPAAPCLPDLRRPAAGIGPTLGGNGGALGGLLDDHVGRERRHPEQP
jgi:hypothetical protein